MSNSQDNDDWAKTNYNFSPKQSPPADEWGKTAININVPRQDDFDKTLPPGQSRRSSSGGGSSSRGGSGDWDATQANIHIPRESYDRGENFGNRREPENHTMPYFQLPEAERAKYQNLPPAEAVAPQAEAEKKKGTPSWIWAVSGLLVMFLFALAVLALVYFVFLPKRGFDLTVKGAPPGSEILVDNQRWNLSAEDGSYKLPGLKAGEVRTIEVKANGYTCKPQQITGENGVPKELVAQCQQNAVAQQQPPTGDCQNIKKGEFAKAAKCAEDALNNLKDPFTVQELLNAMNLYIINFPTNDYQITKPEDKAFLQKAAGYMQKLPPNVIIQVGGHTDNVGNKVKNDKLSIDRATSVKKALIGYGVKESILDIRGYGDTKPRATNDTEDGRFMNRRIEYSAIIN